MLIVEELTSWYGCCNHYYSCHFSHSPQTPNSTSSATAVTAEDTIYWSITTASTTVIVTIASSHCLINPAEKGSDGAVMWRKTGRQAEAFSQGMCSCKRACSLQGDGYLWVPLPPVSRSSLLALKSLFIQVKMSIRLGDILCLSLTGCMDFLES